MKVMMKYGVIIILPKDSVSLYRISERFKISRSDILLICLMFVLLRRCRSFVFCQSYTFM